MSDTKYKVGDAVHVKRAGAFGTAWVKATYEQAISDYHTVKEFGGSYRDGVSIRPATEPQVCLSCSTVFWEPAHTCQPSDVEHPSGCGWESCPQPECHNPSDVTENSQKPQNPSNTPNAEARLSSKTRQKEFTAAEALRAWRDQYCFEDSTWYRQATEMLEYRDELKEAQMVIREQGERLAWLEATYTELHGTHHDDTESLRAERDDAREMEKLWKGHVDEAVVWMKKLLDERDETLAKLRAAEKTSWAGMYQQAEDDLAPVVAERNAALARVKELEEENDTLANLVGEERNLLSIIRDTEASVAPLQAKVKELEERNCYGDGRCGAMKERDTLRATIARVDVLMQRLSHVDRVVNSKMVVDDLTAALKGESK